MVTFGHKSLSILVAGHLCCFLMYSLDESASASGSVTSRSVSPSPTATGHPRNSLVRNHFVYDSSSWRSVCQVHDSSASDDASSIPTICGHSIAGKFPSNLRQHLKSCHSTVFSEMLAEEERQKMAKQALKCKITSGPI